MSKTATPSMSDILSGNDTAAKIKALETLRINATAEIVDHALVASITLTSICSFNASFCHAALQTLEVLVKRDPDSAPYARAAANLFLHCRTLKGPEYQEFGDEAQRLDDAIRAAQAKKGPVPVSVA
jgi:hypothetical protein